MSSPTNSFNDTSYMAYITEMRQYIANRKAADSQSRNITPSYNFPVYPDLCQIGDVAAVNPGLSAAADAANASDDATVTGQTSSQFAADGDFFCGGGYAPETDKPFGAFASGTGNFNESGQPAAADFFDAG